MFFIPCKIDWDTFVRDFPSKKDTWTRELKYNGFDCPDEDGLAWEWADFAYVLSTLLPSPLREPFCLFSTSVFPEDDGVELPHILTQEDEESLPYPHFDPAGMQQVFNALDVLLSHDLDAQVRNAWKAFTEKNDPDLRFFANVDQYVAYMNRWVAVLAELKKDRCVLGYMFA